jgi:hypothetical protein
VAWHTAVFNSQAKVGKLDPWSRIRAKLVGESDAPPVAQDWRARKVERQQQMAMLKKHQRQRSKPPVARGR